MRLNGQTRTLKGRILAEDLEGLPQVRIQNMDSLLLGETDADGRFVITIQKETEKLLLSWVGMEWTTLLLTSDCNNVEVIMMRDVIYDFMSPGKIDRLRMKRFKILPELHQLAFEKGLFEHAKPCFKQDFIPY